MNLATFFRGLPQVARQEFLVNLRSVRFVVMGLVLALVVVGGTYGVSAAGGGGPVPLGPDLAVFFIISFINLIVPIFAIVVAFDAVSKERVQGTMDLLLSRPVTKTGVLLGKFFGAFGVVAFPVTLVLLAGLGILSAKAGSAPSGAFAATFIGMTLLLIAYYVLLQLIFSSLAKTSGTAVLFGVLVWLLFTLLYGVITLVLGFALFPSQASRNEFNRWSTLGNPGAIAANLMYVAAPASIQAFLQDSILDSAVAVAGAAVWFVVLLVVALWVFERKAAA